MINWLIKILVDNRWVRLALSFRWILGTKNLLTRLVNESELAIIEKRYTLLGQNGFFSGKNGASHQQDFIQALFSGRIWEANAFIKTSNFLSIWSKGTVAPLIAFFNFIHRAFFQTSSAASNKNAFIDAMLATSEYRGRLSEAMRDPDALQHILIALTDAGCFANEGKTELFIDALTKPDSLGKNPLSYAAHHSRSLTLIYTHLVQTQCFVNPANKQKLIRAIFSQDITGSNILLNAAKTEQCFTLILNILTKADCFHDDQYKMQFLQLVRANENAVLYHVINNDPSGYLALHECLLLAGCSIPNIKRLLNEPIQKKYGSWTSVTPLMIAIYNQNDALITQLKADGAELSAHQKMLIEEYVSKQYDVGTSKAILPVWEPRMLVKSPRICAFSIFHPTTQLNTEDSYISSGMTLP